ncbi:hypothetical protein BO70DRAFT_363908 [Aspergillus heteromorphus CBS 117.55]|uniref:BAG domain-containing protein n=1 Tax=Aspergillus heteromorphus CBS 117.55 TaxID=1448321 RepID=A0A317VQS3_9EURO|nr:uncharacterized protein BO70DRAFT_363908 [Aspergillus heteromorphus CBS 117.55]PWY76315.1 hypothetical protein BO70DRAFT_363908 [Aspergillus heteromorphus CBS 117.55]
MSQLLSHSSLSSLGETCASYIDHVATNLPPSLHSLHHQILTTLSSAKASSPLRFLTPWPELVADHTDSASTAPVAYTVLACTVILLVMFRRSPFANLWRRSPSYTGPQDPPHVTDNDYSYITQDDIVNPSATQYPGGGADTEPDVLRLKHRRDTYDLHFPAYAINDGALSVGQLRQRAAEVTRTPDPNRIKLLYKGKLLETDSLPCRSEGLKQQSEVLCVVSGVEPGESSPSDVSEAEADKNNNNSDLSARPEEPPRKRPGKNRKRHGKKKKNQGEDANGLAPPAEPSRPSSAAGRGMPPASPALGIFRSPLEQANGLMAYLQRELLPRCEEYLTSPPPDAKARDFEHKMLSEVILAQVILKADGIEPASEEDRAARRALIKEAQRALNSLDQAAKI